MEDRDTPARRAYAGLRHLLLYSQLPAGVRLGEVEWSGRLGVHRAALREAMGLLAHEGLLTQGRRGGYFTPLLEQRDIDEIWEARATIEVGAIHLIAQRDIPATDFARLLDICDTMQRLLDTRVVLGFAEADRAFHDHLVTLGGNQRLIRMYRQAALPHFTPATADFQVIRRMGERTIQEHQDICKALRQRRHADAAAILQRHLNTTGRFVQTKGESQPLIDTDAGGSD